MSLFCSIGAEGAVAISVFLRCCSSITFLDLSGNNLTDSGAADIIQGLERESEFEDADNENTEGSTRVGSALRTKNVISIARDTISNTRSSMANVPIANRSSSNAGSSGKGHGPVTRTMTSFIDLSLNHSLTDLRLCGVGLGQQAAAALVNSLKTNATLTSLYLDFNTDINAKEIKRIMGNIRAFNVSLHRLSMADTPLTVNSASQIFRIFGSADVPLSWLCLARCNLLAKHLSIFPDHIYSTCALSYLDVSQNPIGDDGCVYIAAVIKGKIGVDGVFSRPPLRHLDISGCHVTLVGVTELSRAMASSQDMKHLNISENDIGCEISTFVDELAKCSLIDLRMNKCNLRTKGTITLLQGLSPSQPCGRTLRNLLLSENNIGDSLGPTLSEYLKENNILQNLDLGFNGFTNIFAESMKEALEIHSESSITRKAIDLNVTLVGNYCEPYLLDMPGRARSKMVLRYAPRPRFPTSIMTTELNEEDINVSEKGRDILVRRTAAHHEYLKNSIWEINNIS